MPMVRRVNMGLSIAAGRAIAKPPSMIRKSGYRFSEKIMLKPKAA